ncbi:hypothetical protein BC829DRAFT_406751 [Chytridium lagenaria]|nr:hypothetical protein BC829DRAFT_406751 [Chytridium lagenaria]
MNREHGHLGRQIQTATSAKRIKVLSMGEPNVGKSCLIKRYCEARVGNYGVKTILLEDSEIKVNFWDVGKKTRWREVF